MNSIITFSWLITAPFTTILLLKATALLSLGGIVALLFRNAAPAVRHCAWTVGLCGALILPVMMVATPAWRVGMLTPPIVPKQSTTVMSSMDAVSAPSGLQVLNSLTQQHQAIHAVLSASNQRSDVSGSGSILMAQARASWPLLLWILGSLVCLGRIIIGNFGLRRLQRRASPLTAEEWQADLERERIRAGVNRPVYLCSSAAVTTPLTWGMRFPVIMLPEHTSDCPREYRVMVLRHELAHIARNDSLTQLIAAFTCALYWFHPLAWFAARRQYAECECACDAQVLSYGTSVVVYATQLLRVARSARAFGSRGYVSMAMARPSQLERRLLAILYDDSGRHTSMSRSARIGGVATLLVITLAVSAFRPVTRAPARAFAGKNTPQQTIISTTRSHATKYPDVIKLPHHDDPAITLHTNADTEEQDVLDSLIRRERFRKSFDSVMSKDRLLRKRVDSIEAVSIQRLRSNIHGVGLAWFTQPTDSTNRVSRQVNPNRLRYNLNPLTPLDYRSLRKPMDSINAVNTQIKELLKNLDNIRAEMEQIEQRLQSQANQR